MQVHVFNDKKNHEGDSCPFGLFLNKIITLPTLFGERLFGERDIAKHPLQSPPSAFETEALYEDQLKESQHG